MGKIDKQEKGRVDEIDEFCKNEQEKRAENIRSNITFRLDSPHYVTVLSSGKEVGSIWSELGETYRFPYPHDNRCINKVQFCGFDSCSQTWGCGRYEGKKDLVVDFLDPKERYWDEREKEYKKYVEDCISKKKLKKMQSFNDFCRYNIGQFDR